MLNIFRKYNLQLFADGVPGDAGAIGTSAGVSPAAAGQEPGVSAVAEQTVQARSLESFGVPKDRAEKYRALKAKSAPVPSPAAEVVAEPEAKAAEQVETQAEQVAAAEAAGQEQVETNSFNWDELKNNPEFKRKMSEVISARVKGYQGALEAMAPMLAVLGEKFGVDTSDPGKIDYAALSKAVVENDWFYEDAAMKAGEDVGVFKKNAQRSYELDARDRAQKSREKAFEDVLEQVAARNHEKRLKSEAIELKKQFPNFDLDKEMANPRFKAMVSPGGGLTLQQAYRAFHYQEIEEGIKTQTAQHVQKALTSSIQTGRHIPAENGAGRTGNAPAAQKLFSQMNKEERAAYREGLRTGRIRY